MNRPYTQTQNEDARCDENAALQMQRKRNFCKKTPIAMETPSKEWKREVGDMHRGTWRGEVLRKRRGNVKVGEIVS
jgi:hypothetical protein